VKFYPRNSIFRFILVHLEKKVILGTFGYRLAEDSPVCPESLFHSR